MDDQTLIESWVEIGEVCQRYDWLMELIDRITDSEEEAEKVRATYTSCGTSLYDINLPVGDGVEFQLRGAGERRMQPSIFAQIDDVIVLYLYYVRDEPISWKYRDPDLRDKLRKLLGQKTQVILDYIKDLRVEHKVHAEKVEQEEQAKQLAALQPYGITSEEFGMEVKTPCPPYLQQLFDLHDQHGPDLYRGSTTYDHETGLEDGHALDVQGYEDTDNDLRITADPCYLYLHNGAIRPRLHDDGILYNSIRRIEMSVGGELVAEIWRMRDGAEVTWRHHSAELETHTASAIAAFKERFEVKQAQWPAIEAARKVAKEKEWQEKRDREQAQHDAQHAADREAMEARFGDVVENDEL